MAVVFVFDFMDRLKGEIEVIRREEGSTTPCTMDAQDPHAFPKRQTQILS